MYTTIDENEANEFKVKEQLENERKNIKSFDDLIAFLQKVKDTYNTGYGIAPRAIAQAALATAWYLSSEFGITGFQASFVMWDFIMDWQYRNNKCGMRIVNYDDMLYPQYEYKFDKIMSKETFETLQKEARNNLLNRESAHPNVISHWLDIISGKPPFGYTINND